MGKAGRAACIAAPMILIIASFVCLVLIEVSGWNKGILSDYYFMRVNFTYADLSGASDLQNTTTLTQALKEAQNDIADIYEIHLWNYCTSDRIDGKIGQCTGRQANFVFDPVTVWHLNDTSAATSTSTSSSNNPVESAANHLKDKTEALENELLGDTARKALEAYKKVGKAMFILYAISFWTTLITIFLGIFALFSRWGSFLTWIFAFGSSVINIAAVILSTAIFIALTAGLRGVFDNYNINVDLGRRAMITTWLSVVFSWAATLFWLFSVCCCSGRDNPHHRSNKGGLMNAEPKGQGYGDYGRGRAMRVEKTGGGYERVASPFLGHAQNEHGDRVPLTEYPQQTGHARQTSAAYEPFRHS